MKKLLKYILITSLLMGHFGVKAQKTLSFDESFEIAKLNNNKLRTDQKYVEFQKALVSTAYSFDPTQLSAEGGQFNSVYFDAGFGISQSFQLPRVYQKKKEANIQRVNTAEAYAKVTEVDLKRELSEIYSESNYLQAKIQLLAYQDSLLSGFQQKAISRWKTGETDVLEKTTADQQRMNIRQQLAQIEKMKKFLIISFNRLLNDTSIYVPEANEFTILIDNFTDSTKVLLHPEIAASDQEIKASRSQTEVEKTALLPQFNIGYRNLGIRGTGADNKVYGWSDRFSSIQIGMSIPLFKKGIEAGIKSAQIMEEVKQNELQAKVTDLKKQFQQYKLLYEETMVQIRTFENESLPNARLIRSVSEKKFTNGDINYLEYVMLINQAIQIESEYLELIRNVNSYIINLNYLTSNY